MPLESFNVYRELLSSLHQGVALWEPNPIEDTYDQVSIGDVGYVHEGFFYRMFNVTLPSNDPSNNKLGKPDDYTPLNWGRFVNVRKAILAKGDHYSRHVSIEARGYNVAAIDPSDAEGNKYECRGQGALLFLPHDGHRKDVIRTKAFEKYIRENVAQWFAWSQRNELDVERMEDLILVTGCTLATSWAAAAFVDPSVRTDICLAVQPFNNGGARFTWSNIHGMVANHNSHSGPDPALNQCIFIRGFRAKRVLFRTRPIRATAEPLPDDPDSDREDEIEVTRVSDAPNYRDPLIAILDYIGEDCAEDTIAIAHDNDLQLIENVENMTASAVEIFLREHQIPVVVEDGAAMLRGGEPPVPDNAKAVFYATVEPEGEPVPLVVHPVLTEYLLRLKITGPADHDYDLPPEEITSLAVHPPMLSLILENHQDYPELIYIRASSGVGVTVEDVLRTIHEELRTPLPRSLLSSLIDVGRYLLNALFYAGRETEQQGVASCRFDHLRGRDRLQVLPKHPLEETAPCRPILSSAESLDEPSPVVAAPSFVNATPQPKPYKMTSALGSIHRTVLASMPSHEGIFVSSPALCAPRTADPPMHHSPGPSQSPLLQNTRQPGAENPSVLRRSPSSSEPELAHHREMSHRAPALRKVLSAPQGLRPSLPRIVGAQSTVDFKRGNRSNSTPWDPELQVLPKHPLEDTAPRRPISPPAESLDEPLPYGEVDGLGLKNDSPAMKRWALGLKKNRPAMKRRTLGLKKDGPAIMRWGRGLKKAMKRWGLGLKKNGPTMKRKEDGPAMKRRALLIGIAYYNAKMWSQLEGPHDDVDRYRELLFSTYGYRPEDVVVLKDDPRLPELLQPTRANVIRELKALVSDAAPGDRFTLLYSGHSDQQGPISDMEEEDGLDEMLITSDEKVVIDNELRDILVLPLPVGCSLLAVLDTCHSGTMLDLPHHHCNNVYVPWRSTGERRTMTMQNVNGSTSGEPLSIESVIEGRQSVELPSGQPLQLNTKLGESRPGQREMSLTSTSASRYASPEARFVCDGWCKYSEVSCPNVLSLSACSDLQDAWEGPNGSLTTVLCNYLKKKSYPLYGALMSHINFQLYDNALALHEYTREQRKKTHRDQGDGFDGELDNFQEPELSSLVRLNMEDTLQL